ncbi:MAG: hypothetical protein R6T90_01455 [Dissulfuribacterales bacterium]
MDRKEILSMGEEKLLDLVHDRFSVTLGGLEDTKYLSAAWEIVEKLERDGWTTDIRIGEGLKRVDGYKFDENGPGTIFAQYGHWPSFNSVTEGICKTALIAYEEN